MGGSRGGGVGVPRRVAGARPRPPAGGTPVTASAGGEGWTPSETGDGGAMAHRGWGGRPAGVVSAGGAARGRRGDGAGGGA